MWILAAILSALFAGITAILTKCGVKETNSDVATAVRTFVVLIFAWIIVFLTGAHATLSEISARSWIYLILSGLATGASWICYFKALSLGNVSKVAAVDKSSTVLAVLLAIVFFADERRLWWLKLIFLAVIAAGTYLMIDIKQTEEKSRRSWLIFALLSAVFAAATSLLAKVGIRNVDTNAGNGHSHRRSTPPRLDHRVLPEGMRLCKIIKRKRSFFSHPVGNCDRSLLALLLLCHSTRATERRNTDR